MIAEAVVDYLLDGVEGTPSAASFVDDYLKDRGVHPAGVEDHQIMRTLRVIGGYYLVLWDTGMHSGSHHYVGYRFVAPGGRVLFQGTDLGIPGNMSIDSDEVVRELLKWITLQPGDTDEEYFEKYTPDQLAFVQGDDAEQIRIDLEYNENAPEPPFRDLEPGE